MGRGSKETTNSDGTTHHTDYNDIGRHSYDYDDRGNVTGSHATYNDNQDKHYDSPDHSMNDVSWTQRVSTMSLTVLNNFATTIIKRASPA